ncbi:MAG: hypothetical protein ACOCQG_06385 [Candidatus Nanoarchaeia archaeon]
MKSKKSKKKAVNKDSKISKIKGKKTFIIVGFFVMALIIVTALLVIFNNSQREYDKNELKEFNECLFENGVRIYGMEWCPSCVELVEKFGGKEEAGSLYIECSGPVNRRRCELEMITGTVPEVQLNGKVYQGKRSLEGFAEETGCKLPSKG